MSLVKMCKDETNNSAIQISEIHFSSIRPRGGLIGFVSFTINNALAVSGVGVHTRSNGEGIRLLYPSKCLNDGKEVRYFYPLSRLVGDAIEQSVYQSIVKFVGNVFESKM